MIGLKIFACVKAQQLFLSPFDLSKSRVESSPRVLLIFTLVALLISICLSTLILLFLIFKIPHKTIVYTPPLLFTSARLTWLFFILRKAPITTVLTPHHLFIFNRSLAVLRFTNL